jgi:hypothetical protein
MSKPTEHKTVQARILAYAQEMLLRQGFDAQVCWTLGNRDFHFPTLCYSHP